MHASVCVCAVCLYFTNILDIDKKRNPSLLNVLFHCSDLNKGLGFDIKYYSLQQWVQYNMNRISCKVTYSCLLCMFPGNISTSVKQEVSSVSSHGPESCASAQ